MISFLVWGIGEITISGNVMEKIKKVQWDQFRAKLLPIVEQAANKNNHHFDKQVDKALLSNGAFLFLVNGGFFVLRPIYRDGLVHVEVLFAYSERPGNMRKYQPVIERLTREIGGRSVIFYTALKTVVKFSEKKGYVLDTHKNHIYKLVKGL